MLSSKVRCCAGLAVALVTAAASCGYPTFSFGAGGEGAGNEVASSSSHTSSHGSTSGTSGTSGTGGTSSATSTSSSGFTCADVHGAFGCCDVDGNNEYCLDGTKVVVTMCPLTCGWEDGVDYYGCTGFGADPTGVHPMSCGSQ